MPSFRNPALDLVVERIEQVGAGDMAFAVARAQGWQPDVLREIVKLRSADKSALQGGAMRDYYVARVRALGADKARDRVHRAMAANRARA